MNDERDEYVLGEDVTANLAARHPVRTLSVSVSLDRREIELLEAASLARGSSVTEFIREAIRTHASSLLGLTAASTTRD
jgi:uncharacterized protein (DUF1778 family)